MDEAAEKLKEAEKKTPKKGLSFDSPSFIF